MAIKNRAKAKKPNRLILYTFVILLLGIVASAIAGKRYYNYIFKANVSLKEGSKSFIYIPSEANFEDVLSILTLDNSIKNKESFIWVAEKKQYTTKIKGGKYELKDGMSNNSLVNMLRSGRQVPVKLTFNNIRTKKQLASHVAKRLETDSLNLVALLNNNEYLKAFDKKSETAISIFIPNTYEIWWNTTAEGFVVRMHKEYQRFWNTERLEKAKRINLSPSEVSTLASIVDEETIKNDEKPIVAGLYLNRLRKGIRLQADPTIKFAMGNFNVNRILSKDLKIDSPYNTYKYAGLPPGPIRIPSVTGIDAVLNHTKHNYLYMCAKEDFSGYHNFAKTLKQHNQNADRYRRALSKNRIYR